MRSVADINVQRIRIDGFTHLLVSKNPWPPQSTQLFCNLFLTFSIGIKKKQRGYIDEATDRSLKKITFIFFKSGRQSF